jgi:hypothetical protein
VDTNEVVLGKAALADLGRDRERRKGDEKRRLLLDPSGLSVCVEDCAGDSSGVFTVAAGSYSLDASRECAGS